MKVEKRMAQSLILVTGATGTVGSEVVKQLVEQRERVRVLTRDPERAKKFGNSVEVIRGDMERPKTLGPASLAADKFSFLPITRSFRSWKDTRTMPPGRLV